MTERKDDLDSMECDSLLYGALASLLSDERPEAIEILTLLVEKLKRGDPLVSEDIVSVACSFMDDLAELGMFDDDSDLIDDNLVEFELKTFDDLAELGMFDDDSDLIDDNLVEFELKTFKDEDPKKRLN